MGKKVLPVLAIFVVTLTWADTKPVAGTIISEASVDCESLHRPRCANY